MRIPVVILSRDGDNPDQEEMIRQLVILYPLQAQYQGKMELFGYQVVGLTKQASTFHSDLIP